MLSVNIHPARVAMLIGRVLTLMLSVPIHSAHTATLTERVLTLSTQASELRFWPTEEVVDEDPDAGAWEEPSRDGKRRGRSA